MLTALDGEESQIKGLDLQADDYITKPFSMPVLIRKIAAILRRTSKQEDTPHIMSYKDLTLDLDGYKVYSSEGNIELTPREFESEQNRCAMACQGCGAVFLLFLKKAVDYFLKSIYC